MSHFIWESELSLFLLLFFLNKKERERERVREEHASSLLITNLRGLALRCRSGSPHNNGKWKRGPQSHEDGSRGGPIPAGTRPVRNHGGNHCQPAALKHWQRGMIKIRGTSARSGVWIPESLDPEPWTSVASYEGGLVPLLVDKAQLTWLCEKTYIIAIQI